MTSLAGTGGARGGPLMMLVLLLLAWTSARALWWENPFPVIAEVLSVPMASAPPLPAALAPPTSLEAEPPRDAAARVLALALPAASAVPVSSHPGWLSAGLGRTRQSGRIDPQFAAAHQLLWRPGLRDPLPRLGRGFGYAALTQAASDPPPFLPAARREGDASSGRWSVDGWAFWRQGSDAAPVSQGRVPIYGASQVGAVLQYRLAPAARRDPRLYARAYRALVRRGESELALGASARLFPRVPVRVAGEVRLTGAAFTNEVRPSAYAVTELAPIRLPYGAQIEAYGQAGWVGGASATAFADGQASVTREVKAVVRATDNTLRLSIGAGAWGGAQVDAQRIDLGPTMRLDLTVGEVPARLSLDWRERVGGGAGPDSGLAATLSARF